MNRIFRQLKMNEINNIFFGKNPWSFKIINSFESSMHLPFRISPFAFLIKKRNYCALYHSLNLTKIFGDDRLIKLFNMGRQKRPSMLVEYMKLFEEKSECKDLKILIDSGLLIPAGIDPYVPLKLIQKEDCFKHPQIKTMFLILTNDCNMRCRYCTGRVFNKKTESIESQSLSRTHARLCIDLFLDLLNEDAVEPKIIYYGGEPLLNCDVFYDSLRYLRERQKEKYFRDRKINVSAVSNGTLITEEIAENFKKFSVETLISLDGLKHHHNLMRIFGKGGTGSFEDVLRGYSLIKKIVGQCGILFTIGSHNHMDIEEIMEFFLLRLECRKIIFNILRALPSGNNIEIPGDIVAKRYIDAVKVMRRLGRFEMRIIRNMQSFIDEEPLHFTCDGYGGQIAININGDVGPCNYTVIDKQYVWGHIEDKNLNDKILSSETTRSWCARSPMNINECFNCIGLGLCGGGCAEEAYFKHGSIYDIDKNHCDLIKSLIEWMFDDLADKLRNTGSLPRRGICRKSHKQVTQ